MGRMSNFAVLVLYLLIVPAGVFFYFFFHFTRPPMGYSASTAGVIAGVLALVGLALIPVALLRKSDDPNLRVGFVPAKSGRLTLVGFLVVMGAVVVRFAQGRVTMTKLDRGDTSPTGSATRLRMSRAMRLTGGGMMCLLRRERRGR